MNPETQFDSRNIWTYKSWIKQKTNPLSGVQFLEKVQPGRVVGPTLGSSHSWTLIPLPPPPAAAQPQDAERGKTRHTRPAQGLASSAVGGAEDFSFFKSEVTSVVLFLLLFLKLADTIAATHSFFANPYSKNAAVGKK